MKKNPKKISHRIRQRQSFALKILLGCGSIGAIAIIGINIFLYVGDVQKTKARTVEIIPVENQVFTNDMSLPAPQFNHQKIADENTIFIQTKKNIENNIED